MLSFIGSVSRKVAIAASVLVGSLVLQGATTNSSSFLHGIDVSRYQQEVNWKHVKEANIAFAFMKATEGDFHQDPYFSRNWEQSRQQGIKRGAYHFFLPWADVERQLAHFKNTVTLQPGDLPPVLDVETFAGEVSDEEMRQNIRYWLEGVEAHYGVKPIIYTYQMFYDRKLRGHFAGYNFWIARYKNQEPTTHPKDKMAFWQYSERGTVSGISLPVDVNWFFGDMEALNKFCVPAPPAVPAPSDVLAQTKNTF